MYGDGASWYSLLERVYTFTASQDAFALAVRGRQIHGDSRGPTTAMAEWIEGRYPNL